MDDPKGSLEVLPPRHEAYLVEAQRLQAKYASSIHIIIGFEAEFIRPDFGPLVHALAEPSCVDFFIGSVHHVHSLPIDYDAATYAAALAAAGGSEERLYEDYYDLQHAMLTALRPRIVGHFDLVRLLSEKPERDIREWKGVWGRVKRNLELVAEQGGWLECNTAALRKGLDEPYPCRVIAEVSDTRQENRGDHLLTPARNGSSWEANSPCLTIATESVTSPPTTLAESHTSRV